MGSKLRSLATSRQSSSAITFLLLAGLLLILIIPLAFGRELLPSDLYDSLTLPFSHLFGPQQAANGPVSDWILQFYPYKHYLQQSWLSGRFAFWNPYILCGYPQYAETMATNFDVLNLLLLPFPFRIGYALYNFAPLLIAGMGMWWLNRAYGVRIWIARIGAVCFMLNGLFFTHLYPHFIPGSFCWVPILVLYIKQYVERRELRSAALASLFCALSWLGGNLQTAVFVTFVVIIFALAVPNRLTILKRVWMLVCIFAFASLLSLVMWLPTLQLFYQVVHNGTVASSSLNQPYTLFQRLLTVPMLLTFLAPNFAAIPNGFSIYRIIGAYTIDFNAAIGFFPLLIAGWVAIRYWRSSQFRPFLLLAVLGLFLPIATPLYHFLYHRFFIVVVFGSTMLFSLGLERMLVAPDFQFRRFCKISETIAAVFLSLLVIGAATISILKQGLELKLIAKLSSQFSGTAFADGNTPWMISRIHHTLGDLSLSSWSLWATAFAILLATIGIRQLRNHRTSLGLRLLWIGTAAQLVVFGFHWIPKPKAGDYPIFPETAAIQTLQADSSRIFVDRHQYKGHQYIFLNNGNVEYHIADIAGFESLLPRSFYATFLAHPSIRVPATPLLSALGVGHIVTGDWVDLNRPELNERTAEGLHLYKNTLNHSRAWFASSTRVAPDSIVLDSLLSKDFDRTIAYFPPDDRIQPTESSPIDSTEFATLSDPNPETVVVTAHCRIPRYLILSDTYYPGWSAAIDGVPSQIFRVNYAMRAVLVPAGSHKIRFEFKPITFTIGWIGSAFGLVLLLIGVFKTKRST